MSSRLRLVLCECLQNLAWSPAYLNLFHRIAASFTAVVNSLVSDVLLPPISLLPFMSHKNLPEKFAVLRRGPNGDKGYNTVKQAAEDGAVIMAYGYDGWCLQLYPEINLACL